MRELVCNATTRAKKKEKKIEISHRTRFGVFFRLKSPLNSRGERAGERGTRKVTPFRFSSFLLRGLWQFKEIRSNLPMKKAKGDNPVLEDREMHLKIFLRKHPGPLPLCGRLCILSFRKIRSELPLHGISITNYLQICRMEIRGHTC